MQSKSCFTTLRTQALLPQTRSHTTTPPSDTPRMQKISTTKTKNHAHHHTSVYTHHTPLRALHLSHIHIWSNKNTSIQQQQAKHWSTTQEKYQRVVTQPCHIHQGAPDNEHNWWWIFTIKLFQHTFTNQEPQHRPLRVQIRCKLIRMDESLQGLICRTIFIRVLPQDGMGK